MANKHNIRLARAEGEKFDSRRHSDVTAVTFLVARVKRG